MDESWAHRKAPSNDEQSARTPRTSKHKS
jgi:hypothetical protein